jgi:hypothetical protein
MGKQSKLNKKSKGFGQKGLIVSFGKIVDGETAKMRDKSSLLEFTATKGEHTISGYVHPTIDKKGSIFVQWFATSGNAPMNTVIAIVNECYKKRTKEAAKEVKRQFQQSDVVIVFH